MSNPSQQLVDVGPSTPNSSLFTLNTSTCQALAVCGDEWVVSGGEDGLIKVWNTTARWGHLSSLHTGEVRVLEEEEEGEGGEARSGVLALAVCGDKLVSGSDDCYLKVRRETVGEL